MDAGTLSLTGRCNRLLDDGRPLNDFHFVGVQRKAVTEALTVRCIPPLLNPGDSIFVYLVNLKHFTDHGLKPLPLIGRYVPLQKLRDFEYANPSPHGHRTSISVNRHATLALRRLTSALSDARHR